MVSGGGLSSDSLVSLDLLSSLGEVYLLTGTLFVVDSADMDLLGNDWG